MLYIFLKKEFKLGIYILAVLETSYCLAVESWSFETTNCYGAVKKWASSTSPDGGIRTSWSASSYFSKRRWESLPHHDEPHILTTHLSCNRLHLWQWYSQGLFETITVFPMETLYITCNCCWNSALIILAMVRCDM